MPYRNYFDHFSICIILNFEMIHIPKTGFVFLVLTYYFYIALPLICPSTSILLKVPAQYCLLVTK